MHQDLDWREWLIGFDYRLAGPNQKAIATNALWPPSYCIDPAFVERVDAIETLAEASWIGPNPPLWSSLDELRAACTRSQRKGIEFLAISALETEILVTFQEERRLAFPEPETNPATLSYEWELLGCDVADRFYLSALYNIGFGIDSLASKLNEHGLFDEQASAADFALVAAGLAPEHAPFFVFSLRRVLRLE